MAHLHASSHERLRHGVPRRAHEVELLSSVPEEGGVERSAVEEDLERHLDPRC